MTQVEAQQFLTAVASEDLKRIQAKIYAELLRDDFGGTAIKRIKNHIKDLVPLCGADLERKTIELADIHLHWSDFSSNDRRFSQKFG
ncbi:hypothetical protein [uncultured Sulfitobacter sp.]|uniref:hypothetical protein n=1 Tax=uncultured Sulfitobacter sp. TaxID=191468 RepID=UPI0026272759|nr:hypothetical protein [uncultured Sulfitobacter sp.]